LWFPTLAFENAQRLVYVPGWVAAIHYLFSPRRTAVLFFMALLPRLDAHVALTTPFPTTCPLHLPENII
jgi:hypothetical protein